LIDGFILYGCCLSHENKAKKSHAFGLAIHEFFWEHIGFLKTNFYP
jgi:hypothetical protein